MVMKNKSKNLTIVNTDNMEEVKQSNVKGKSK